MATTTLYQIVAHCDPYHAKLHISRCAKVLKRDGATPIKWVYDDNYGRGYSLEEAHKAMDDLAWQISNRCDDFLFEDKDSVDDLINTIIEDEGLSRRKAKQLTSWYTQPGFYNPERQLLYALGDSSLDDDVMSYGIEEFVPQLNEEEPDIV